MSVTSSARPRFLAWEWPAALLGVSLLAAIYRHVQTFVDAVDHCELLFCDFVTHYRPMGRDVLVLPRPDAEFFYPPFAALFFAPFGALPPRLAMAAWGACLACAAAVLVHLPATRLARERPGLRALSGALVVLSFALLHAFKWGQVSPLLTALTLLALVWREEGRLVAPATLLSLAISVKAYPALVLLHPLARKDLRFLAATALGTLGFSALLPAAILGPHDAWAFFVASSAQARDALDTWVFRDPNSQYLPHVLARTSGMLLLGRDPVLRVVSAGFGLVCAGLSLRAARARHPDAVWWSFSFLLGAAPFLLQTSWPHYFAWLPPAQVLVTRTLLDAPRARTRNAAAAALGGSLLLGTLAAVALFGSFGAASARGALLGSNLLLLSAAAFALPPAGPTNKPTSGATPSYPGHRPSENAPSGNDVRVYQTPQRTSETDGTRASPTLARTTGSDVVWWIVAAIGLAVILYFALKR